MSSATAIEYETIQNAPLACLPIWPENLYRLVNYYEMLTLDAGRLARAMQYLAETSRIFDTSLAGLLFSDVNENHRYVEHINAIIDYCNEASFPMTKIPLERIVRNHVEPRFTTSAMAELLKDAMQRLRDESEIHQLLKLSIEASAIYSAPLNGWEDIVSKFPDVQDDIEEMNKCFALSRYTASVFHSLLVIEGGLIVLGKRLGVTDPKEGWDATCKKMELILKAGHPANTSGLDFAFIEQTNVATQAIKQAWRNKVNHAAGRLAIMKTGFADYIAEEIMHATRAYMRILAHGL
jgi:hypothetical protein